MRPNQQNRRNRGRNNNGGNNRKGPNPLSRSYESNGPDVKIRGSAQQIADKYATLARDATSAGDRVMAENYFQHAEHYNRIIATAMAANAEAQRQRDAQRENDPSDRDNDDDSDDGERTAEARSDNSEDKPRRGRSDNRRNRRDDRADNDDAGEADSSSSDAEAESETVPVAAHSPADIVAEAERRSNGDDPADETPKVRRTRRKKVEPDAETGADAEGATKVRRTRRPRKAAPTDDEAAPDAKSENGDDLPLAANS
ncbi:hypothetical protein B7H23_07560 [Notoacmeibacter marinus]|uniref:DUF4167 domain-containing protein n=1 Tax=Notoacmeibacter marinus TaxID=1876515 RepID=A0A231V3H6_9HYPH|nr:DUF4167 domain-containing protein [Notoacmeibacter marinus]OXT02728.1 hypothetical protein B7H23_07560 [Notoacmeibacter marinus]